MVLLTDGPLYIKLLNTLFLFFLTALNTGWHCLPHKEVEAAKFVYKHRAYEGTANVLLGYWALKSMHISVSVMLTWMLIQRPH